MRNKYRLSKEEKAELQQMLNDKRLWLLDICFFGTITFFLLFFH